MKGGDRVRMTKDFKRRMAESGSAAHVQEFGGCEGVVEGPVDWGGGHLGPEWNVRWKPSRLRYAYHATDLEQV